ncbi:MAG: hypothetical protein ABEH43_01320, partial [Flavobacteriales bacterium]
MNTENCKIISYCLKTGAGNAPCEATEPNEDIELQYSVNGNPWQTINHIDQGDLKSWKCIEDSIPQAAQDSLVRFRWRQTNFSACSGCDNWA